MAYVIENQSDFGFLTFNIIQIVARQASSSKEVYFVCAECVYGTELSYD